MTSFLKKVDIRVIGIIGYDEAMLLQDAEYQNVRDGISQGAIFLLEHDPPVITVGRRTDRCFFLLSENELANQGYQLRKTTRGGLATAHEPGQAVVYFVIPTPAKSSASFVLNIMRVAAEFIARTYGIQCDYDDSRPGLWINGMKLCSCGFDFTGGISRHGIAINVSNSMKGFSFIVPCGMPEAKITSISEILHTHVDCRSFLNEFASFLRVC